MKAKVLLEGLELVKAGVGTEANVVEITKQIRSADSLWWAQGSLEGVEDNIHVVLPYSQLRNIVKTLEPDEDVKLAQRNVDCVITAGTTVWKLNLKQAEVSEAPLKRKDIIDKGQTVSGHLLLDAVRSQKHLMRTDLSRPGLLLAWTSPKGYLIVGDGTRMGGRNVGVSGIEIPVLVLQEIGRILCVRMVETVYIYCTEKHVGVVMGDSMFCAIRLSDTFEVEWYERVMSQLIENSTQVRLSRSEFILAISKAQAVVGLPNCVMTVKNSGLILESKDESGQKCVTRVPISGEFLDSVVVDISHLALAVDARKEEMVTMNVADRVVSFEDKDGWEVLLRKEVAW